MKYIIIDSCFFINAHLSRTDAENLNEQKNIIKCNELWKIIKLHHRDQCNLVVYILDLCIAETFKAISKHYYQKRNINKGSKYQKIIEKIENTLRLDVRVLKRQRRNIFIHDFAVNRDILVGISRFHELVFKNNSAKIGIVDLAVLSLAKYLIDFYKIPKKYIMILSSDEAIIKISKLCKDIPTVKNPYRLKPETLKNYLSNN